MAETKHKCWTCIHAGNCKRPIKGWVVTKHHNSYDDNDLFTVHKCPNYIYDGECMICRHNKDKIRECLYNTCPYFIKGKKGRCSQANWKRRWEKRNGRPFIEVE